jgi:glycosyltransferase involved in cell wall biosynthesis
VSRRALFWTYDPTQPSFRHRLAPLAGELARRGWSVEIERFPRGRYLRRVVARRRALAEADLLVFAKINLAPGEGALLARLAPPALFDFDDAIWLRKPRAAGLAPGRSAFRERKFAASCRAAALVLAGNEFLAARARRADARVEVVPTGVDLAAYAAHPRDGDDGHTVVWIGLPENLPYLDAVRPALARLAARGPAVRLRVVSSAFPDWPEVPIERRPWSAADEIAALASSSIGIMPLADDDWSRGKCAFKLLQYMAAGLPTVASPVGQNAEVVVAGETGLLARTSDEWEGALGSLLASAELRARLGRAGREALAGRYDSVSIARRAADLAERAAPGRESGGAG